MAALRQHGCVAMADGEFDLYFGAGHERFDDLDGAQWHEVTGGGLPHAVLVRLRETDDGRLACTGIMLGVDGDAEVTAADLRLPLGKILTEIRSTIVESQEDFGNLFRLSALGGNTDPIPTPPRRVPGGKGPSDSDLAAFAQAYSRALATEPNKAVKRAAEAVNISVPTAHRWKAKLAQRPDLSG